MDEQVLLDFTSFFFLLGITVLRANLSDQRFHSFPSYFLLLWREEKFRDV